MIHCSGVVDISGKCVTTDRGEHLQIIGNYHPMIGHSVWTDGVVCYGEQQLVGGQQPSIGGDIGYLFFNGSAINYLNDYFDEKQYCAKQDNSYVVTGVNHVWVLGVGDGKISGTNTTDMLDAEAKKQRKIEIPVPKESEVRDACVDDEGNLHMIVLTVDGKGVETIRIYKNDALVVSKNNVKTIKWPDGKTDEAKMIAWYAHIEKDGAYNVLSAYVEEKKRKAKIGKGIPYTGLIKGGKDYQQYTGKTWPDKMVTTYEFRGFWYNKKIVKAKGIKGRDDIRKAGLALNLRQIDEKLKNGEMQPEDIYGDWYADPTPPAQYPLYSTTRDQVNDPYHPRSNGNVPLYPMVREAIFYYRDYHQYKIINDNSGKEEEVYSVEAYQDVKQIYPTVTPDEIKYCSDSDPNDTEIRVIVNPPGSFFAIDLVLHTGDDPWDGYFHGDCKDLLVAYYIDKYPGDYKREDQRMIVAAYREDRPPTDPTVSDPKIDEKSKPSLTIPCGDAEIKLGEIKPITKIKTVDDIGILDGDLKTGSDDGSDPKRMIGRHFTSDGQIMSIQFMAEDTWIADAFKQKDSKNNKDTLILTGTGLKAGSSGELISGNFSSLYNTRVNYYKPIQRYLKKH